MRTYEIEDKESELKAELARLAVEKTQQAEREREERLDQIAGYDEQANIYRQQAVKALTDEDKQRLYRYADDAESQANELRKELGLVTTEQIQDDEADKQKKVRNRITDLLRKALFLYLIYLGGDYFSAVVEQGFLSFALKSVASILYAVSVTLGGSWLAYSVLSPFLSEYILNGLRTDFKQAAPVVRLGVLLGLFFSLLFVLATLAAHGN
ncbi:hypothetical protein [Spirosoma litoris]